MQSMQLQQIRMLEEALMQILSRQNVQPPRIKEQSRNGRR